MCTVLTEIDNFINFFHFHEPLIDLDFVFRKDVVIDSGSQCNFG